MMDLSLFYSNLYNKEKPVFKIGILLFAIMIVNYLGLKSGGVGIGAGPILSFIFFEIILIIIDPLYAFVYAFVVHVDIIACLSYSYVPVVSLFSMFYIFFINKGLLQEILRNPKIKMLISLGFILGIYLVVVNIGLKSGFNRENFIIGFGYIFGFFAILPAYYFSIKRPKDLFQSLTIVAACCLLLYFLDLSKKWGIFKLDIYLHLEDSTMERMAGYDIRQFMIFFSYLIPAAILAKKVKNLHKLILLFVGVFSYLILVLAFYRLAMFYVGMGLILSFIFIRKYADTRNLFKYLIAGLILIIGASLVFGNYFKEINNIIGITFDYFNGKGGDDSADARFEKQLPILKDLFYSNPLTGVGVIEIQRWYKVNMMGFVDFPVLGTLAAYGIVGMFIYYLKYIIILTKNKIDLYSVDLDDVDQFPAYLYLTIKAYIITMITFRFFYISWEFTFDYMQAEFGLLTGAYFALQDVLKDKASQLNGEEYENEDVSNLNLIVK